MDPPSPRLTQVQVDTDMIQWQDKLEYEKEADFIYAIRQYHPGLTDALCIRKYILSMHIIIIV